MCDLDLGPLFHYVSYFFSSNISWTIDHTLKTTLFVMKPAFIAARVVNNWHIMTIESGNLSAMSNVSEHGLGHRTFFLDQLIPRQL